MRSSGFVLLLSFICICMRVEGVKNDEQFSSISQTEEKGASYLFLVDGEKKNLKEEWNHSSIPSLNPSDVADMISHLVGGPVINPSAQRSLFPSSNFFQKSRGNLQWILLPSSLSEKQVEKLWFSKEKQYLMSSPSHLPSLSLLSSLSTGYSSSSSFPSLDDQEGYEKMERAANPSLFNLLSFSSQGSSRSVSASSNREMASVMGASPFFSSSANEKTKNHILSFSPKRQSFTCSFNQPCPFQLSKQEILIGMSKRDYSFPSHLDASTLMLTINNHSFNLSLPHVYSFFAELELFHYISASVDSYSLLESCPHLFAFVSSGISGFTSENQFELDLIYSIFNHSSFQIHSHFSSLFEENYSSQFILLQSSKWISSSSVVAFESALSLKEEEEGDSFASLFHITLWFGILLIVMIVSSVLAIYNMDIGKDSIIYRLTSLNPQRNTVRYSVQQ